MILSEAMKRLLELKLKLGNNGIKIEDIQTIDDGNYGYLVVLTKIGEELHNELLKLKMKELNAKQVMPDLWVLGPFLKEEKKED